VQWRSAIGASPPNYHHRYSGCKNSGKQPRSFTANARAQPKEASIESANNSRRPGSVHGAFIAGVAVPFVRTLRPPTRRGGEGPTSTGQGLVNRIPLPRHSDDEMSLTKWGLLMVKLQS
jgi:hypothetical protein